VVEDHPNCSFADLWGVSILLAHDPILSKNGVSGNPGAVHLIDAAQPSGQKKTLVVCSDQPNWECRKPD
jgi:hypothetical protein